MFLFVIFCICVVSQRTLAVLAEPLQNFSSFLIIKLDLKLFSLTNSGSCRQIHMWTLSTATRIHSGTLSHPLKLCASSILVLDRPFLQSRPLRPEETLRHYTQYGTLWWWDQRHNLCLDNVLPKTESLSIKLPKNFCGWLSGCSDKPQCGDLRVTLTSVSHWPVWREITERPTSQLRTEEALKDERWNILT